MKINCKQANQISIKKILESFSLFPSKENFKTAFYFAVDRDEKTPSLHVDYVKNTAFDFGNGKSYDCVSIVQIIKKCNVSEALEYLAQFDFSFQKPILEFETKNYEITRIKPIEHPALIQYLKFRRIYNQRSYLQEIHFEIKGKKKFGLGFKNNSEGYEIRNKYEKLCLGKKDITYLKKDSKTLRIFEGFSDFLSFLNLKDILEKQDSDYVILNSTSMVYKLKNILSYYSKVEAYLDNDSAGDSAIKELKIYYDNIDDERLLYKNHKNHKDLNELLMLK